MGLADDRSESECINMACYELSGRLELLECSVPEAAPLARTLLRVVGRVVIDTTAPGAPADAWPNTEEMALRWIDEALKLLGYAVRPAPGSGWPELTEQAPDWE